MNTQKSLFRVLSVCFTFFLSGCVATVNFPYTLKSPPVIENQVNSSATIYFSIEDLRAEPDIIGYQKNMYGINMKKIKTRELDISNSIYLKYKEVLSKKGFVFSDNVNSSDMKLTLSITTLLGEMSTGVSNFTTNANCFMKVALISNKDNKELFTTNVWGKGEKKSTMIANINDIPEALSIALDDALKNILGEIELVNSINNFNK